jgi:hypothetical protein
MHCSQLYIWLVVTLRTMQRVARPGSAFWVVSGVVRLRWFFGDAVPGQTKLTKSGRPSPSHVPGRGVGPVVTPGIPSAPSPAGSAWSGLLHRAALRFSKPLRRMPDLATHGDTLSHRVSANAEGRRSSFLRGRFPLQFQKPLRPRGKDDAGAPGGCARRPGLKSSEGQGRRQFAASTLTVPGFRKLGS